MKKCSKEELMAMAGIDEEAKRIHKKTWVDLDIEAPVAYESVFMPKVIHMTEGFCSETYLCKHEGLGQIRSVYESLLGNYEREICDVIRSENKQVVYLIVMRLLAPGFKPSNKFRYVGFISVSDDIINLVWIHPFLRNKGMMKGFILWYALNENNLVVQPPVFPSFARVMNSVQEDIRGNPEYLKMHMNMCRKFLKKKSPKAELDQLSDEDILRVRQGCEMACAMKERGDVKIDLGLEQLIDMNTKLMIFLKQNPDSMDALRKYYEENPEYTFGMEKLREDWSKYGHFKKPDLPYPG